MRWKWDWAARIRSKVSVDYFRSSFSGFAEVKVLNKTENKVIQFFSLLSFSNKQMRRFIHLCFFGHLGTVWRAVNTALTYHYLVWGTCLQSSGLFAHQGGGWARLAFIWSCVCFHLMNVSPFIISLLAPFWSLPSSDKNIWLDSPACVCMYVVWCWAGNVWSVYQCFETENSCLLQTVSICGLHCWHWSDLVGSFWLTEQVELAMEPVSQKLLWLAVQPSKSVHNKGNIRRKGKSPWV